MAISIIVPTYNRYESLNRLLKSIEKQKLKPNEVIIIDASENKKRVEYDNLNIKLISSNPSVCVQRNIGIEAATSDLLMFCDDDIELPNDYLYRTNIFLENNPQQGIVTGLWRERNSKGEWITSYPITSIWSLTYNWIFGLSVWGSVERLEVHSIAKPIHSRLSRFYKSKGNTLTKAGWPLVTQYTDNPQKAEVTSLGSALIRKSWLKGITFDESLHTNGYGENYGVCVQLKQKGCINILQDLIVLHYHSKKNRIPENKATYYRTLALGGFVKKYDTGSYGLYIWSVFGLIIKSLLIGNIANAKTYLMVMYSIIKNKKNA